MLGRVAGEEVAEAVGKLGEEASCACCLWGGHCKGVKASTPWRDDCSGCTAENNIVGAVWVDGRLSFGVEKLQNRR